MTGGAGARSGLQSRSSLSQRLLTAAIAAPPTLALLLLGPVTTAALVAAVVIASVEEWTRLAPQRPSGQPPARRRPRPSAWVLGALSVPPVLASLGPILIPMFQPVWVLFDLLLLAPAAAALLVWALSAILGLGQGRHHARGALYLSGCGLSIVWLALVDPTGLALLIALVWATDILAFFGGRAFGGAKLAPAISPKKTWSGLVCGMIGAGIAGVVWALLTQRFPAGSAFLLGLGIAALAQMGDLYLSKLKRQAGVKDSGDLLPGHGGILDRIDGLLPTAPTLTVVFILAALFD